MKNFKYLRYRYMLYLICIFPLQISYTFFEYGQILCSNTTDVSFHGRVTMNERIKCKSFEIGGKLTLQCFFFNFFFFSSDCGYPISSTTTLISDGKPAVFGDHPWAVAIYKLIPNSDDADLICGGTLISPTLILSGKFLHVDTGWFFK